MRRIVFQMIDFPDTIREDLIGRHQIVRRNARRIGQRQRCALYRPADRPPDIDLDDAGTVSNQPVEFCVAKRVTGALRAALGRVVDVDAGCRTAIAVGRGRLPGGSGEARLGVGGRAVPTPGNLVPFAGN